MAFTPFSNFGGSTGRATKFKNLQKYCWLNPLAPPRVFYFHEPIDTFAVSRDNLYAFNPKLSYPDLHQLTFNRIPSYWYKNVEQAPNNLSYPPI
jgi:hypothetical protein